MSLEGKSVEEIQALAELADSLGSDPKTRMGFLNLAKTANPNVRIAEIDIPNMLAQQFAEPLKKLEALEQRNQQLEMERRVERQRQTLIESGVSAKDVTAIEKLMVEKQISDHKTAAEYFKMSQQSAQPTPAAGLPGVRKFDTPTLPDMSAFKGDTKAYTYNTAYAVIDEILGRRA
jgi:hypothetical protein